MPWTDPQVTIKFPSEEARNSFVAWMQSIGGESFCNADHFTAERQQRLPIDRLLFDENHQVEQRATNRAITAVIL